MNKFKRLMKNNKGISPIFATLILIAIAVIAGVVVYMFTSGTLATMTGGGTTAQEKITIQAVSYSTTNRNVTLYVQPTGGPNPIPSNIIVKDSSGNTVVSVGISTTISPTPSSNGALSVGTLYTLNSLQTGAASLPAGTYTATLVTNAGGSFVSQSFVVS